MAIPQILQRCYFCKHYFEKLKVVAIRERPEQATVEVYICQECEAQLDKGVRTEEQ